MLGYIPNLLIGYLWIELTILIQQIGFGWVEELKPVAILELASGKNGKVTSVPAPAWLSHPTWVTLNPAVS